MIHIQIQAVDIVKLTSHKRSCLNGVSMSGLVLLRTEKMSVRTFANPSWKEEDMARMPSRVRKHAMCLTAASILMVSRNNGSKIMV